MNERIRELAEQAHEYADNRARENITVNYFDIFDQKFAELIVRECVRHFNEDYHRDFDTNWREDLSKSIQQHFGVEE